MSKVPTISVDVDVDLNSFDDDDIIEYLEGEGYTVIRSASNASESAGALDDEDSGDGYDNYTSAIRNMTKVCRKYEDLCTTFYQELLASILNLPSYTDKETLISTLKERL